VEEDPDSVELREWEGFLSGFEDGDEAEQEGKRKEEDAERDSPVSPIDKQKRESKEKAEKRLRLVGVDGKAMMRGVEHLRERNEVEEKCRHGCRNGDVPPPGTVIERCREDRQRGDAIKQNRDSKPKKRHANNRSLE
jgi:hypothetical protein